MKKLLFILLFSALALNLRAEQKVIIVEKIYSSDNDPIDLSKIEAYLKNGWKVEIVSSTSFGSYSYGKIYITFVLYREDKKN
jgi:hypothetical protein